MRNPGLYLPDPQNLSLRRSRSYSISDDGRIWVDPGKRGISPFTLTMEPEVVNLPAGVDMGGGVIAAGIPDVPQIMPVDRKGPFEVCYAQYAAVFHDGPNVGKPANNIEVIIFDPEFRPVLMNRAIHIQAIAGGFDDQLAQGWVANNDAAGRPFIWPETFFMQPEDGGKAIFFGFRNLDTSGSVDLRFTLHGVKYYGWRDYQKARKEKGDVAGAGRVSVPYFYTTDRNILMNVGDKIDFDIRVTDEADFELWKLTKFSDGPFLARIQEKEGKRNLDSSGPGGGVHSDLLFGSGEWPMIPFETAWWEQDSKIMLHVENTLMAAGTTNRIWAVLCGRKIAHLEREFKDY